MTDLGNGFAGSGDDPSRSPGRSRPFFTSPPGPGLPAAAPTPAAAHVSGQPAGPPPPSRAGAEPAAPAPSGAQPAGAPVVKGRIRIGDEVVEKIAALAALEVTGVAALGRSGPERGIKVDMRDGEISLDVFIVVEYGGVIMEVAKLVKANVARVVGLMVGLRVTAVNIEVDDVRMPGEAPA